MTRILVQRGSSSSSSRSLSSTSSSASLQQAETVQLASSSAKDEEHGVEIQEHVNVDEITAEIVVNDSKTEKDDDRSPENSQCGQADAVDSSPETVVPIWNVTKGHTSSLLQEEVENEGHVVGKCVPKARRNSNPPPPPPPVPPREHFSSSSKPRGVLAGGSSHQRFGSTGGLSSPRIGPARRTGAWSIASSRTSPNGSKPSSPRNHHCETEGYNSADEQGPGYESSYDETEKEHKFEIDIRCAKGFEIRRMLEDGNCLFRAVADQVYGDSEVYDMVRQMCIDYLENERDHFSQFITEGFTSYCMRKRRDKVYGNNMEIQSLAEMYNRPIHIYNYSTEPINIFQRSYDTDTPPIRLSYHHGNHYNSLFDPRRLTIGVGLGFSSLQGRNIDKDQVKAAIRAQQDQQIEKALLAEGRFYSDLELTEKEMERMVIQASRADYIAKQNLGQRKTSTSGAEPSSSGTRSSTEESNVKLEKARREEEDNRAVLSSSSSSMQMVLSMGFSYLQAIEAYGIFGDDVESMVCYLVEMGSISASSYKGKATE